MDKKTSPHNLSLEQKRQIESGLYDAFRNSKTSDLWLDINTPKIENISPEKIRISTQEELTLFETSINPSDTKNTIQRSLEIRVSRYERMESRLKAIFGKNVLVRHNLPFGDKEKQMIPLFLSGKTYGEVQVYLNKHIPTTPYPIKGNPYVTEEQIIESICKKLDQKEESGLDLPTRNEFLEKWNTSSQILLGETHFYENKKGSIEKVSPSIILFEKDSIGFDRLIERIKNKDMYTQEKARELTLISRDRNKLADRKRDEIAAIESKYAKLILSREEMQNLQKLFVEYFTKPPLRFATNNPQIQVIELIERGTNKKTFALYVKPDDLVNRQGALVYFGPKKEFEILPWEEKTRVSKLDEEKK